jgi:hypothetical protein
MVGLSPLKIDALPGAALAKRFSHSAMKFHAKPAPPCMA